MGPHAMCRLGAGDLHPSLLRVEFLRVAAAEDFECALSAVLKIDVALRILMREPIRRYEIRHKDAVDLIAILVIFDRIADLAGPEDALGILVCAIEPGSTAISQIS